MFDEDAKTRSEIKRLAKQLKKSPLLFARLGDCYFRLGDPDRAELILKRGLQDHPHYLSGLLVMGEVYLYKGYLSDAEERAEQGLKIHPNHLGLLQLLQRIRKGQEQEQELHQLRSVIRTLDPLHVRDDLEGEETQTSQEVGEEGDDRPAVPISPAAIWKMKAAARQCREAQEIILPENSEFDEGQSEVVETPSLEECVKTVEFEEFEAPLSPAEPAELDSEDRPAEKKIITKTLGELYARQNQFDEAIDIYLALLEKDPDNEDYQARVEELLKKRESAFAGAVKGGQDE